MYSKYVQKCHKEIYIFYCRILFKFDRLCLAFADILKTNVTTYDTFSETAMGEEKSDGSKLMHDPYCGNKPKKL